MRAKEESEYDEVKGVALNLTHSPEKFVYFGQLPIPSFRAQAILVYALQSGSAVSETSRRTCGFLAR